MNFIQYRIIFSAVFLILLNELSAQSSDPVCLSGNCFNGFGKCQYFSPDSCIYEGNFVNGKWEGTGTLDFPGKLKFQGNFKDFAPLSPGKITYANGDSYDGELNVLTINGKGTYYYQNGKTLSGEFKDAKIVNGTGYLFENSSSYEGGFQDGVFHGYGVIKYKDGTSYSGNFYKSNYHGYGEATYTDGIYKGNWNEGKRQGSGKFYSLSGSLLFDGTWENNEPVQVQTKPDPYTESLKYFNRTFKGAIYITLWEQKGSLSFSMDINLKSDLTFTGYNECSIIIDEVTYKSKTSISGSFDVSDFSIRFYDVDIIRQDALPNGLYWIKNTGANATLYQDSNHSGYYLIRGKNSNGDNFELSDY